MRSIRGIEGLAILASLSILPRTNAQVSGYFPSWLPCIQECQPLWSANYDCTQAGQVNIDCLCGSTWLTSLYQGDSCSCDSSQEDAQAFQNWLRSDQACGYYAADSSYIAGLTSQTSTSPSPTPSSTGPSSTTSTPSKTRSSFTITSTSKPSMVGSHTSTASAEPTTITTNGSTFTTVVTRTATPTNGASINTNAADSNNSKDFFNNNKKWFIPVVVIGSLLLVGSIVFAILFFCFDCCRRRGYKPANIGPGGQAAIAGGAGILPARKKAKKPRIPFFGLGRRASQKSQNSQSASLVGDQGNFHDSAYYGAGGRYPPMNTASNFGNTGLLSPGYQPLNQPYQHGAPLAPIEEVRSIAETQPDAAATSAHQNLNRAMDDDDESRSAFSFENSVVGQPTSPYSPVGQNGGGGYIGSSPTNTVAGASGAGAVAGAGLLGGGAALANQHNSSNRYEDLSDRRMSERRVFDAATPPPPIDARMRGAAPPIQGPRPLGSIPSHMAGAVRPEWNSRSVPTPPLNAVSPVSSVSVSSGGAGGRTQYPQAPQPLGHPQFQNRRVDYYEDYR